MEARDDDTRPNPDDLLRGVQRDEREGARGKLRIFFGMCPGVGKTYAMLRTAREAMSDGADVVLGIIEHHGREDTKAMMAGFRSIPRKKIEHQGTVVEEFDLDRALEMKPGLVLVDELAHTNAPGSRHPKRYQDVEELLQNGIDVYSTINVQHIASRADLVYQITHVPVRETVPDSVLEMANQIELIDLSSEELLKRLADGKVYLGDRADRAAENFFKSEKLTALRELALRFTAEKVDDQLKRQMTEKRIAGPWNTNDRLLVAVSHSPFSARLIRATRRKAFRLEAPWIALHVDSGQVLDREDQMMLAKNIELVRELGGEVISTRDSDVGRAINRTVREKNVTQIIMGRPDRRPVRDFFSGGTLLDQLLAESSEVDIHVIRHARRSSHRARYDRMRSGFARIFQSFDFFPYWASTIFLALVTFAGYAVETWIGYRSVGYVFLAAILLISFLTSLGPTLMSAALSAMAWNYLFIPPRFTFAISEPEDFMMCAAYFVVAITAGVLTSRIRVQERDLLVREKRAKILYDFSRALAEANGEAQVAGRAAQSLRELFGISAAVLLVEQKDELASRPCHISEVVMDDRAYAVAAWSFKNRKRAGFGTETLASAEYLSIPLIGKNDTIGVLLVARPEKSVPFNVEQDALLDTIASHLAIALERELFAQRARKTEVLEESEKLHQTILNSVSHELRTPLATILGAASALGDARILADGNSRATILGDLGQSADRLNRIVENLLDMSRLSGGVLAIRRDLFDWTDALESSFQRILKSYPGRRIELREGEEALVLGDHRLLEHVLQNLVANAIAYSPSEESVEIFVGEQNGFAVLEVTDRGPGVPDELKRKIFERFYRVPGTVTGGTGLGLSIVQSIVAAHGGSVTVTDRSEGKGSVFKVKIPVWRKS